MSPHHGDRPNAKKITGALALATISTVFPGFLIGALSQQVSTEFDVSASRYGWATGAFFIAAMTGSIVLGKLGQVIGPRRQISVTLVVSACAQLTIASAAQSFEMVMAILAVAGFVNAGNQSAVNLALTQAKIERLGVALAVKQSSMPAASMLAGFAVPGISLTIGWRWAFVLGAALAICSLAAIRRVVKAVPVVSQTNQNKPTSRRADLLLAGIGVMFIAFSAGALNGWTVGSGVDAGLGEGSAGLLLSVGAICGITGRMIVGFRLDRNRAPFRIAGFLTLAGALGVATMSLRDANIHSLATIVAFGAGWVWPVPTNFGIIKTNESAAGAATGVTQTGVYIGVATGAPIGGWLIQQFGYDTMWLVVATSAAIGASITLSINRRFMARPAARTLPAIRVT